MLRKGKPQQKDDKQTQSALHEAQMQILFANVALFPRTQRACCIEFYV